MLKPFRTEGLAIRELQIQDAADLARISDTPAVSQWLAFMEGGFPRAELAARRGSVLGVFARADDLPETSSYW